MNDHQNEPPGPPEKWAKEKPWEYDTLANEENSRYLDENDLRGVWLAQRMHAARHAGRIAIWSMYIIFGIFLCLFLLWLWHWIAPPSWGWMSSEQLSKVQSVIFSGSMGALASGILQKFIATPKEK